MWINYRTEIFPSCVFTAATNVYFHKYKSLYIYTLSPLHRLQSTVYSLQSTVYSLQSTVCSLQSAVYSLQSTVCSLQSTVYSLQSAVYSPTNHDGNEKNFCLTINNIDIKLDSHRGAPKDAVLLEWDAVFLGGTRRFDRP